MGSLQALTLCWAFSHAAYAQEDLVLGSDLAKNGAVRMTPLEMKEFFFVGSSIAIAGPGGDWRVLRLDADYDLTAHARSSQSGQQMGGSGRGKWSLRDDGVYCVRIQWRAPNTEKWCLAGYKYQGGKYLAPENLNDFATSQYGRFQKD
jgi:hypothetical protein